MTKKTFEKITQPVLTLYYFKNKVQQDSIVKVSAMLDMMEQLGTPANQRRAVPVPEAGHHVIGSYIKSGDVETVERAIADYMINILRLPASN